MPQTDQKSTQLNGKPAGTAQLILNGQTVDLPIIVGTEDEKAIDITQLRAKTEYITLDQGYGNTGSCTSAITFIDGERGILRYRGIPIEELAEEATFMETAFLLIYGYLPTRTELEAFQQRVSDRALLHEDMKHFFNGYPSNAHPMAILSAMTCSLSTYEPDLATSNPNPNEIDTILADLLAKAATIAAFSYKKSAGQPYVYPKSSLSYIPNFLSMMFDSPTKPYFLDPDIIRAVEALFVLHADHEQNCSTSTVRLVGSSRANLFAAISAGICALWGPLHGGANQEVLEMLEAIQQDGGNVKKYVAMAKDKTSNFRLMGFGHRVYKSYDPRAKVIKKLCDKVLAKIGKNDPLLDIARTLEETALKDPFFVERKLYPNIDFYSGIIYRAIGIPTNMFTVMFALGRVPGWIAHWKEMIETPGTKIGRPRQVYTGLKQQKYVPIHLRG